MGSLTWIAQIAETPFSLLKKTSSRAKGEDFDVAGSNAPKWLEEVAIYAEGALGTEAKVLAERAENLSPLALKTAEKRGLMVTCPRD